MIKSNTSNLSARKQRGVATVFISIVLLTLLTLVTFYSSRFLVFEQNISGNQYRSYQAFEAAQMGLERGVAWLQTRSSSPNIENWGGGNTTTCKENSAPAGNGVYSIYSLGWSAPSGNTRFINPTSPCNLNIPISLTTQMGQISYNIDISYIQTISNIADIAFVKVIATATSQDSSKGGSARVEQVVSLPAGPVGTGGLADSPIIVKDCMTGVTGNPDICPANVSTGNANIQGAGGAPDCATGTGSTGVALVSLQAEPSNAEACLPLGSSHLKPHGGTRSFLNTPSATVWDTLFPNNKLTEQMVQTFAAASVPGFVYYNAANAPAKIPAQGTADQPVIIYVDSSAGCISLAPGDFHALVYYETTSACDLQGGGSVDLTGTIAVEGSITKFNANTIIRNSAFTSDWQTTATEGAAIFARVPGTWRDFQ